MFGISVATAGDVNGDGFSDVIVGASNYDNGQTDEGRAYVYLGSPRAFDERGLDGGERPGHCAVRLLRVDGGRRERRRILRRDRRRVPLRQRPNRRRTRVRLPRFGLGPLDDPRPGPPRATRPPPTSAGRSATAGDVNGDGYADVIVGAYAYDNGQTDEGRAYVYWGPRPGSPDRPRGPPRATRPSASFGWSVATAGDVNGDGYADVVVGALGYDNGQTDEGRAFVYLGSATGPVASPAWTTESDQASAYLGYSVGTAGDVNGDGYADVVVGSQRYDDGQTDEGRAFVLLRLRRGTVRDRRMDGGGGPESRVLRQVGDDGGRRQRRRLRGRRSSGRTHYDNGQADEGRAYVISVPPPGPRVQIGWTVQGNQRPEYSALRSVRRAT